MVAQSLLYQRIETLVREARQAEDGADHSRAASLYSELAQWEEQYAERYVNDPKAKGVWQDRVKAHRVRSDHLRHGVPTTEAHSGASPPVDAAVKGDAAALLAVIDGLIVKESPVRWDDIAGLEDAKQDVKLAFALAMARAPEGVRLPTWERILLYGPPGTGKTLLASAVAGSIPGCTFFNAQWSQLSSKWYGETPKTISLLYQRAREKAPSVVFLDEADYIAASRDESGRHEASIAALNTLLEELSGLADKVERRFIFTFAATNRPRALDDAFLSRFAKAGYVPLPDVSARQVLLRAHLEKKGIKVNAPYDELARLTEHFSGREIATLCTQAVMLMVGQSNPELLGLVDKGLDAIRPYLLKLRPLTREDFEKARQSIRIWYTPDKERAFEEWRRDKGF